MAKLDVRIGHNLKVLREMPDASIDCVVTSPPYWGLRNYGTDPQIWGGVEGCEHEWGSDVIKQGISGGKNSEKVQIKGEDNFQEVPSSSFCVKCNAWKGEMGLEPTPALYIKHLCDIFDEVKRVLKKTGTCFVNLGDSYGCSATGTTSQEASGLGGGKDNQIAACARPDKMSVPEKCLAQIPSRFAIEMTDRGWILRNRIVWYKRNAMPSSVSDRFTTDFEDIFFFTKSKKYCFEQQFEPLKEISMDRYRSAIENPTEYDGNYKHNESRIVSQESPNRVLSGPEAMNRNIMRGRNMRTVWDMPTEPFAGAHFACFTPELPRRCISAGSSSKGCCSKCGAPWERDVERVAATSKECPKTQSAHEARGGVGNPVGTVGKSGSGRIDGYTKTLGWQPTCTCNAPIVPSTVLDIFGGSGTTGMVALELGRNAIVIELNPKYADLIVERTAPVIRANTHEGKWVKQSSLFDIVEESE